MRRAVVSVAGCNNVHAQRVLSFVHRWPLLALVTTAFAGLVMVSTPAALADAPECSWTGEYARTIAQLHENPALFHVLARTQVSGQVGNPALGSADTDDVSIASDTPCRLVSSVLRHQHMHLQQYRLWGGLDGARLVYHDRLEIVADCASMLAGSRYTPYVDKAGGSTAEDITDARSLLRLRTRTAEPRPGDTASGRSAAARSGPG